MYLVSLVLIVVLTGCGNGETTPVGTADASGEDVVDTKGETNKEEEKDQKEKADTDKKENEKEEDDTASKKVEKTRPKFEITDNWYIKPIAEDANKKIVLLTIDDAPDEHALEMAKTLKELNAKAIFFVNGHFLNTKEEKEILQKIHDMGFEIGNHTYHHEALRWEENGQRVELAKEKQKKEIVGLNNLIEDIIGERPKFFRAPHGMNTDYSEQLAAQEGMALMNWSYGYDWNQEYQNAEALTDIMLNTELLGNGANLLMHDREWTAKALDNIVRGLRDKGYEMVDPGLIKTPE